jgi:hypothetical protein
MGPSPGETGEPRRGEALVAAYAISIAIQVIDI